MILEKDLGNGYYLISRYSKVGEAVPAPSLYIEAWNELEELQCTPRDTWVGSTITTMSSIDRYEIGVLLNGVVVSGCTLVLDDDPHVGKCLAVHANYTLKDHRNKSFGTAVFRVALRIARESGVPVLAWTHRSGPWTYKTHYRRVH